MKKLLIILFAIITMTSCTHTKYEVTFVDEKNPPDTIKMEFVGHDRWGMIGRDSKMSIRVYNEGDNEFPLYIYSLYHDDANGIHSGKLYRSKYPITIVDIKCKNKNN